MQTILLNLVHYVTRRTQDTRSDAREHAREYTITSRDLIVCAYLIILRDA
jgi:hypothetical protein